MVPRRARRAVRGRRGTATGRITYPGHEHPRRAAEIVAIDAPHRFAFRWHPYAVDPSRDYADEPTTLVTFTVAEHGAGTRLTVCEQGFDALPADRRDLAFRMNEGGWAAQAENVAAHVGG